MAKKGAAGSDSNDWTACINRIAQDRDREAFLAIFEYFAPRVNSYLLGQGVEASQAEDLTQEAMLTLWNKSHLYQAQRAAVSTWLFRIARNLWIDRLRRQRGIAYEFDETQIEMSQGVPEEPDGARAVDAQRIRQALESLPRNQAQVVYMSYFEGKSHSEIALETGMPLGSVKSSLRLALKAFRDVFGETAV